jgi:hypothetical protein
MPPERLATLLQREMARDISQALLHNYCFSHGSSALLRVQTNCPGLQPQNYQPVFLGNALLEDDRR